MGRVRCVIIVDTFWPHCQTVVVVVIPITMPVFATKKMKYQVGIITVVSYRLAIMRFRTGTSTRTTT